MRALYSQAADYGPYRVPFYARPDEPPQPSLLAALCAISAKLGSWTFYALLRVDQVHCSGIEVELMIRRVKDKNQSLFNRSSMSLSLPFSLSLSDLLFYICSDKFRLL